MPLRLVALDGGSDITIDRDLIVVGRHATCDARLESIRVSRRHCCMTSKNGDLEIRDLGSTNGIRINGQRVEVGTVRLGDELAIAHIRYRLHDGASEDHTMMATVAPGAGVERLQHLAAGRGGAHPVVDSSPTTPPSMEQDSPLAAAVRGMLPAELAGCKIQVIVQLPGNSDPATPTPEFEAEAKEQ